MRERHDDERKYLGEDSQAFFFGEYHEQIRSVDGICRHEGVARQVRHGDDLLCRSQYVGRFVQHTETLQPPRHAEDNEEHDEDEGAPKEVGGGR